MPVTYDTSPSVPNAISKKQLLVLKYLYKRSEQGSMWVRVSELKALFRRRGLSTNDRSLMGVCNRMITRQWLRKDSEDGPVFRIDRIGRHVILGVEFGEVQVRS